MKKVFNLILLGVVVYSLWLIIMANIDLTAGRHVLFMDEWVTLDGVRKILDSKTFSEFLFHVIDGWDHRYGRIHWVIISLFSAVPYFTWGLEGLIIAERMIPAVLQIVAFWVLVSSFVRTPVLRILTFSCLLFFPSSSYYSHMPKPEPLQLLLISLFLRELLVKKNTHVLPWFYLGLAFGAKISTLPYFLFIFGFGYFIQKSKLNWLKSLIYSVIGIVCAVPILAQGKFDIYFGWLSSGISHNHDVEGINFFTWYNFAFNDSLILEMIFNVVFILVLILNVFDLKKQKLEIKDLFYNKKIQLFICSMSFLLPVMLNTKRLWFMYFHIGTILLLVWMVATLESWIQQNEKKQILYRTCTAFLLIGLILFLAPDNHARYIDLANRTSSPEFKLKIEEYDKITEFLKVKSVEHKQRLKVIFGADLFFPEPTPYYRTRPTWRNDNFWELEPDYIVDYKEKLPQTGLKDMNPKQKEYKLLGDRLKLEIENTIGCRKKRCYRKLIFPLERIVIFERY